MANAELSSSVKATTGGMALGLLERHCGVKQAHVQRVIDDPARRRQVGDALTGPLTALELTKEQWVERELHFLRKLRDFGLPLSPDAKFWSDFAERDSLEWFVNEAWEEGYGLNHRIVPGGLTREILFDAWLNAGFVISMNNKGVEQLPTEMGVLRCDLSLVMQPIDDENRPFNLNYDDQLTWCKEQGGSGFTSVEELLYLVLRMLLEFGRILFLGGWVRCRNDSDEPNASGFMFIFVDPTGHKVGVNQDKKEVRGWYHGCVPRKFTAFVP